MPVRMGNANWRLRSLAVMATAANEIQKRRAAGTYVPPADLDDARTSFRSFLTRWLYTSREGKGYAHLGGQLWPSQDQIVSLVDDYHVRRMVTLKGGKLGVTEVHVPLAAWIGLFAPPESRVHFFSQTGPDAYTVLDILRHGIKGLPVQWGFRIADDERYGDTARSLKVRSHDGTIRSFWSYAPRRTASISESAVCVVLDELAHMQWGREVYNSVITTIPSDGYLFVLSRGHGVDNQMANLWGQFVGDDMSMEAYQHAHTRALARVAAGETSALVPLFQPYNMRPFRDDAWRLSQAETMTPSALRWWAPETPADALAGDSDTEFVAVEQWDALEQATPLEPGDRTPVVIGLDAGVKDDYTALVGVTRHPERHDEVAVRFVREWKPAPVTDFRDVRRVIRELADAYNVVCVTYDPYALQEMADDLGRDMWWHAFNQGKDRLLADKGLRDAITQRRVARPATGTEANAVLRSAVNAAGIKTGPEEGTLRIVKRSVGKVDPLVALSMARYQCLELNL